MFRTGLSEHRPVSNLRITLSKHKPQETLGWGNIGLFLRKVLWGNTGLRECEAEQASPVDLYLPQWSKAGQLMTDIPVCHSVAPQLWVMYKRVIVAVRQSSVLIGKLFSWIKPSAINFHSVSKLGPVKTMKQIRIYSSRQWLPYAWQELHHHWWYTEYCNSWYYEDICILKGVFFFFFFLRRFLNCNQKPWSLLFFSLFFFFFKWGIFFKACLSLSNGVLPTLHGLPFLFVSNH